MAVFSVSLPVRYLFSIALYVCLVSSTEAVVVEMQQSKSLSGMSTSEHFPTQPATSGSRTLNTHTLTSHLSHSTRTLQHLSEATEVNGRSYAQLYDAVGSYCEEWAVRFNTITDAEQRLQRLDALKRGAERGESGETYNNINRYYHDVADDVARRHNMLHLGQVGSLDGVHYFARHVVCNANQSSADCAHSRHNQADHNALFHAQLLVDPMIGWVGQQRLTHRRRPQTDEAVTTNNMAYTAQNHQATHTQPQPQPREKTGLYTHTHTHKHTQAQVHTQQRTSGTYGTLANQNERSARTVRAPVPPVGADASINRFPDPLWPQQWYLHGADASPGSNINVLRVWDMNITGAGVVVTVVDDGLERNHPDLLQNYNAEASLDVNGNDDDPMPHYTKSNINKHGTRCAGEIAAVAGNNKCTVGVAFNAQVGGVRMLDGPVTDVSEARSIGHAPQLIDIYANSWGPTDDGQSMDAPGALVLQTIIDGVTKGRQGKGSLYVFASGNGMARDNCNADGYANSIYTLSIGAVTNELEWPWYAEPCAAQLAVTFSSSTDVFVATTDLRKKCTEKHSGTSAAAPLGAGMLALVLEANNTLTWRDVQYLLVYTSVHINADHESWTVNGRDWPYSDRFGFGLMDAYAMVTTAQSWQGLRGRFVNATSPTITVNLPFGNGAIPLSTDTSRNNDTAQTDDDSQNTLEDTPEALEERHAHKAPKGVGNHGNHDQPRHMRGAEYTMPHTKGGKDTRSVFRRQSVGDRVVTNEAEGEVDTATQAANQTESINSTANEMGSSSGVANESVVWSVFFAPASEVVALESVTVTVNLDMDVRGTLEVFLQSPCGTISQLLTGRFKDKATTGLVNWTFSSVAYWGENPQGRWLLWVTTHSDMPAHPQAYQNDEGRWVWPTYDVHNGTLKDWSLTVWGSDVGCDPPFCSLPVTPNRVCAPQPWPEPLVQYTGTFREFNIIAMGVLGWAVMMFGLVCVCIAYLRHFNLKSTDEHEAIPMDNLSNTHHRAQRSDYPHTDHAQHPDYLQQPGHLQRPGNLSPATGRSRQSSRSPSPMFGGHSPDAQRSHRINMPLLSNAEAMALDAAGAGESVDGLSAYSGAHRHFTAEDLGNDEDELDEAGNNDGARLLSNR